MCGIAGAAGDFGEYAVARMSDTLGHRGPDASGTFVEGDFALGHRRLAILDLSAAGRQPMASQDGRFVVALNGEIFNYIELRGEIGGEFRTVTDTEVLVEACAKWGVEGALERLMGMFAFALWDRKERELTLARDAMGEKPLVYLEDRRGIAFASEMKALAPLCDRCIDPQALDAYLALGHVPAPLGIFHGIRKLPAGCWLKFRNGESTTGRWKPRPEPAPRSLSEIVRDAVRLRLRSDVPLALLLSGGVDSSVIAAECVELGASPAAFTAEFDGNDADSRFARMVALRLGLRHEVLRVAAPDPATIFEHYDEPFADSSAVGALALARSIGAEYKVVLNGDGGDEAFAGYRHYEHIALKQAAKRAAATVGLVEGPAAGVYVASRAAFRAVERRSLMNGHWSGNALARFCADDHGGALHRAMAIDRELELANRLTYKMDIALGAVGKEGRAPFLDHRVMRWSERADARELVRGGKKKIALRAAYRGALPDPVLDRPKQGFGAPVGAWLDGPWREFAADLVPCAWLDQKRQRGLRGQRLWTVAALAAWAKRWRASW